MKKLMLMACALLLTGAFATGVMAADVSGLYLSGKFVYGYTKMDGFKAVYQNSDYGSHKMSDQNDNAFGGAFAVGYDFFPNSQIPLRAELEYSIFSKVEAKDEFWDDYGAKQKYNIQTLFINGYWDIHNKTIATPYLTAGIGLAFIDTKLNSFSLYGEPTTNSSSKLRTNFAWKVGAGVAFELTENWSLDAGYTFASLGKAKTKYGTDDEEDAFYAKTKNLYMHQVAVGVRYTF